jgi:hypothetical protein
MVEEESGRGTWGGSTVDASDIAWLWRTKRVPPAEQVEHRALGEELVPEPLASEVVVFCSHFECGFGLPASAFFHAYLEFFGLQPHHLGANVVMSLSAFVTFCEGYLGV